MKLLFVTLLQLVVLSLFSQPTVNYGVGGNLGGRLLKDLNNNTIDTAIGTNLFVTVLLTK